MSFTLGLAHLCLSCLNKRSWHEEVVRLLVEEGADIDAQGGVYGNALYVISLDAKERMVRLVLENGADVDAQGGGSKFIYQLWKKFGHIVNIL